MPSRFETELARRVLIFDGAMGTSIHAQPLDLHRDYCGCENCTDILVSSRPDVIGSIHESFLEAGCDVIETDSFGASPLTLSEFGIADRAYELNRAAAEVARRAADRFSTPERPRFVAGSIGPGTRLITLGNTSWQEMLAAYAVQARGLIDGGADLLIIETCQDLLQVKCALNACIDSLALAGKSADETPIMVSVTIETTGTMLLGTSIEAAAGALSAYPILSLGLNCATGPTEMAEHVQFLSRAWAGPGPGGRRRYVSVMPNAGLPILVDGRTEYPLGPAPFAEALAKYVAREPGVRIVGGCCGTTPEHIRQVCRAVRALPEASSPVVPGDAGGAAGGLRPASTSLFSPVEHRQDASFLIIGERCNASGSARFKKLLEAEDWDGIVSLAREQVRDGSHVLDVNTDYAGRDNARDMAEIVRRFSRQVDAPLMIDSTQLRTLEAGLTSAGGKCIINSANFEDGEEKFDTLCRLARRHGASLVIGCIDEDREAAMARTADRKLAIAERAFERAVGTHGIYPADIFFDPLVLPVSTGMEADRRSALELIEGTRRISQAMPLSQLTCGLSNVSFGLSPAARVVLNSALLHELLAAGMTSAIVHASKILPRNRIDDAQWASALDLIYDRRAPERTDPLQAFIELFRNREDPAGGRGVPAREDKPAATLEERLRSHIIDGEKQHLIATLDEARARYSPLDIINDHLLDGMRVVGELFGSGRMQLPFVLQSAEVMKTAVSHLQGFMDKASGRSKGVIVLATVKGDVHDIGKNLVDIILSNNGYTVHNLGIKQHLPAILAASRAHNADAIGMSGLLVKSVNVMEDNLRELNTEHVTTPVLLGGAALSRHYCEGHLRSIYSGECFYGKDAFEGLRIMDQLVAGNAGSLREEIAARRTKRAEAERVIASAAASRPSDPASLADRSDVAADSPVPTPPFYGARVVENLDLDEIYPFVNKAALYRGQWQFKKGALPDTDYEALLRDKADPVFDRLRSLCRNERVLRPAVVYGYFPCASDGDDLIIFDPAHPADGPEIARFSFPRQRGQRRLCISDFFRSVGAESRDVVGMHCVTMGAEVSRVTRRLFDRNDYQEYLYLHGMGVECAEALAELWHKRIRQELGIAGDDAPRIRDLFTQHYRGSRYSFGYPACPNMADQEILFRLLDPARIGCSLTDNHQIDPEQSTSAIIVHHPEAKYFNV